MQIEELQTSLNRPIYSAALPTHKYVVYFLSREGEIVYVGKSSIRGYARRVYHHTKDKQFDQVNVMPVSNSESDALEIERGFISMYRPEYNIVYNETNVEWIFKVANNFASPLKPKQGYDIDYKQLLAKLFFLSMIAYGFVFEMQISALLIMLIFITAYTFILLKRVFIEQQLKSR